MTSAASRTRSASWPSVDSSFVVSERPLALLAGPEAGEVAPAGRRIAVDHHASGLEDHALERRRAKDLSPRSVLRGALRRLLLVELGPRDIERLAAKEAGHDAGDEAEGLVEKLEQHGATLPFRPEGQVHSDRSAVNITGTSDDDLSRRSTWTKSTQRTC